jgi:spore coat polysaccharide biosynthesis protein SpsF
MTFDIITQARFKSTRLPGKILLKFLDTNFLSFFILNLKKIKNVRKIILACPDDEYKDIFIFYAKKLKIDIFFLKGDPNDVLKRYFYCAKKFSSQNIIRITSDCPFINPFLISKMIKLYKKNNVNFLTNNKPRLVPHGFDCEIVNFELLRNVYDSVKKKYDKEHVTSWIYKNNFDKKKNYSSLIKTNYSHHRLTLDTPSDYLFFLNKSKILKSIATKEKFQSYLKKI